MASAQSILFLGSREGFEAVARTCAGSPFTVQTVEPSPPALRQALPTATALVDASMRVPIDDEMVRSAIHLKIISCATTGSDHISRAELGRRGIPLRTLREDPELLWELTPAAEHSWALLTASARRLVPANRHVLDGLWERERFPGIMLRGKQLGLVGCGRLGQWMARYAAAFGMEVAGHDPFVSPWPEGIRVASLQELFENSDFISLHVHLTDETRGMIDRPLLERIKPGAILINTSRGGLLDEEAVLANLASGRLAGFAADVLEGEPAVASHPLVEYARQHDNVLLTPHIGGNSPDAVRLVCRRAAEKVLTYLAIST